MPGLLILGSYPTRLSVWGCALGRFFFLFRYLGVGACGHIFLLPAIDICYLLSVLIPLAVGASRGGRQLRLDIVFFDWLPSFVKSYIFGNSVVRTSI